MESMHLIGLSTCHNRRELTLRALRTVVDQTLSAACHLHICVVDDGSTDRTAECVRAVFPDVVLLRGTSDLYWASGTRYGYVGECEVNPVVSTSEQDDISFKERWRRLAGV